MKSKFTLQSTHSSWSSHLSVLQSQPKVKPKPNKQNILHKCTQASASFMSAHPSYSHKPFSLQVEKYFSRSSGASPLSEHMMGSNLIFHVNPRTTPNCTAFYSSDRFKFISTHLCTSRIQSLISISLLSHLTLFLLNAFFSNSVLFSLLPVTSSKIHETKVLLI